jgi:formylglycine-generating enzyme required for sulfatase activity
MSNNNQFQILHISDLHFNKEQDFDRSLVIELFLKRLKEDYNKGLQPEIVIVTGDIAYHGIKTEYEKAKPFFDELLVCLGLEQDKLFVVPGNHDVNRKKYRKSDVPGYKDMKDLNDELENKIFRQDLFKGIQDYFNFIDINYPHLSPVDEGLVPFVHIHQCLFRKKIGLIGLNSAWMCREEQEKGKIAIGEYQVKQAVKKLNKMGKTDLIIFCFHHPLNCLWSEDRKINRRFFNDSILMIGHLHDVEAGSVNDLDGLLYQSQTGGLYLGSSSKWPQRYHYITFDENLENFRIDIRSFTKEKREWYIDINKGDGGSKEFSMNIKKLTGKSKKQSEEIVKLHNIFKTYKTFALNEHRFLPMQGFETTLRTPIEIEQIYVNMRAHLQSYDFDYTVKGRRKWNQKIKEEQIASLDIKKAFQISSKRKIKDMVILGDPGSGKTTLLKYILVMLLEGKAQEKLGLDSDLIPFFAPLRELRKPDSEDFLSFMKRVCLLNKHKISDKDCQKLLDHKKGIVLLDGLDEVADEKTRIKVCQWIDSARKEFVNTQFIVTSRFAGYLGKSRLEGAVMELSIQDFTPDEVKAFLIRWFETVEAALHSGDETDVWKDKGRKDALELYENIDGSPHLKKLAVNPLILQIIALIRRDRGMALPQRRVELYQECVNVLLEKWDLGKGLKVLISAREARQILQPLALWLHQKDGRRSAPLQDIKKIIQKPLDVLAKSDVDSETLLLNIRDRSGIFMGYSETEYGFAHLSFQEYLAAEEIRNTGQIDVLIKNYNKKWWREVILLSLGLDNPSIIEPFMDKIIKTKYFKTDIGLITDALEDSILKPAELFIEALKSKEFDSDVLQNVIRILAHIGGRSVISALKEAVKSKEKVLAQAAFAALKALEAVKGVKEPFIEAVPAIVKHEKDDSEMVLVPAGKFLYGSREDDQIAHSDEKPQRTIHLPDFYIDVYPVTNRQYCRFLNEVKPSDKNLDKWIELKGKWRNEKCRILQKRNSYDIETGYDNHPVIYVTWYGAKAYTDWAKKRLPTEQEWEKANSRESGIKHTTEAGRYPKGKSPYGCYDMSGNVWEWTGSLFRESGSTYVLRGGSWVYPGLKLFTFILLPFVKILVNILKTYSIRNMTNK